MNRELKSSILDLFHKYQSPNQMLKKNTMILKTLQYDNIPELAKVFCMGTAFAEMNKLLEAFFSPTAPEYDAVKDANEMFRVFVRGEYENLK